MINDKRFDFSEESNLKDALLFKIKNKLQQEKLNTGGSDELCDEELDKVAGGTSQNCPNNGDCSSCKYNKNGICRVPAK